MSTSSKTTDVVTVAAIAIGFSLLASAAQFVSWSLFVLPIGRAEASPEFDFSNVRDVVVTTEYDTEFIINPDFTNFEDDILGFVVIKNVEAKDAKNLQADRGEELTMRFDCPVEVCSSPFDASIFLVDKNTPNKDLGSGGVTGEIDPIGLTQVDCDDVDCEEAFSFTIPDDIDEGKYKLVIDADHDESHFVYINKIRIL